LSKSVGITTSLAIIGFVLLWWTTGGFPSGANEARLAAGACDVPARNASTIVSLTTEADVASGYYDSLDAPEGTAYTVPAGMVLEICQVVSLANSGQVATLEIGYGDAAVSATSTAPAAPVLMAALSSPAADQLLDIGTVIGSVPAGKIPYARHSPGVAWSVHLVGLELEAE